MVRLGIRQFLLYSQLTHKRNSVVGDLVIQHILSTKFIICSLIHTRYCPKMSIPIVSKEGWLADIYQQSCTISEIKMEGETTDRHLPYTHRERGKEKVSFCFFSKPAKNSPVKCKHYLFIDCLMSHLELYN